MKNSKVPVSDIIRVIRENIGYNQDYVATQLGITQQAYSNIEKNPEKATLGRLKEIASILRVNLVTLLGEDEVYIQQNFQQQGGNAATQMNISPSTNEREVYDRLINEMKEEILFLREITKNK